MCFSLNSSLNLTLFHSDRLNVSECLNHKWLRNETVYCELYIPQILTVQTSTNLTIKSDDDSGDTITSSTTKCTTTTTTFVTQSNNDDDKDENNKKYLINGKHANDHVNEEDKENSRIKIIDQDTTITSTITIPFQHINNGSTTTTTTKLVLEKSSSISLFPDAPTTPKVCRKMIYDDEAELKELIVKKYHTENIIHDDENVGECLVCHPKIPTLELDKGITSC